MAPSNVAFRSLPASIGDKIDANFKKGFLTVTLPKTPETQAAEKKIAIKTD